MDMWTYEALTTKSDLVVIAVPVESKDTDERVDLPGIRLVRPENKEKAMPAIGVDTQFEVLVVMKGRKRIGQLTLHHYRLARSERLPGAAGPNQIIQVSVGSGPDLVSFDAKQHRAFLMFLVREKDGRYAPTSGQTDPGMYSIHPLSGPVIENAGQPTRPDNGG
jgi:hypothetical protein